MLVHLGRVGVRSVSQPPFQKALATARRIGASLFAVPDNYAGTLYQDSTGVTPVSTVGQLVGLMLDSTATVGPNLAATLNISSPFGQGYINQIGGVSGIPVVNPLNKTFRITYTITQSSWTGDFFHEPAGGCLPYATYNKTVGTWSYHVKADENDGKFNFQLGGAGSPTGTITFSSFKVEEITGTHATQATTANKPTLGRGLYNLLTWSNDLTNGAWVVSGASRVSNVSDPFGGTSAITLGISAGQYMRNYQSAFPAATTGTVAVWLRSSAAGGASNIRITTNDSIAWNTGFSQKVALTSQWQLVTSSGVVHAANSIGGVIIGSVDASNTSDPTCLGNVDVCVAGLFAGTLTAAQILANGGIPVTTSSAGWNQTAGRYALSFDGSNDTLTFTPQPITTAATLVWAGTVADLSTTRALLGQPNGGLLLYSDATRAVKLTNGTQYVDGQAGVLTANAPVVISAQVTVSGVVTFRVNGVQVSASGSITTNFNQSMLSINSMGAGAYFTPGTVGFCEVSNTILSLADLQAAERAAAQAVGVTLP